MKVVGSTDGQAPLPDKAASFARRRAADLARPHWNHPDICFGNTIPEKSSQLAACQARCITGKTNLPGRENPSGRCQLSERLAETASATRSCTSDTQRSRELVVFHLLLFEHCEPPVTLASPSPAPSKPLQDPVAIDTARHMQTSVSSLKQLCSRRHSRNSPCACAESS